MPHVIVVQQRLPGLYRAGLCLALVAIVFLSPACIKVGPDFVKPEAAVLTNWLEADNKQITNEPVNYRDWWRVFNDPVLDRLIDTAYRQNLSLRIAGARVMEARAQVGIAVGNLFPQTQAVFGSLTYNRISQHSTFSSFGSTLTTYAQDQIGLNAAWEIDFWGRYRRGVESADAALFGTLADYDSALVSLTADVATYYILTMTLLQRIEIARQNIAAQQAALQLAQARFEGGTTTQLDVEQAITVLSNTLAFIPTLQTQLAQARNALAVLLGVPPFTGADILSGASAIPVPPALLAVGIPADLLRRRPDIRSAEYQAKAQGAQIGVAKADLFPAFSLNGTFDFLSTNVGSRLRDMFRWSSREYVAGPAVQWNIFNYGRLTNNVRAQDARFQQLLIMYQNTVLTAQQEVENGLVSFLRGQEAATNLGRSAQAARRSYDLALAQYSEGTVDFTTVLTAEQSLLSVQDNLTTTLGNLATSVVSVYRALGGGWQLREGEELIPPDMKETMAKRTNWGALLKPAALPASDAGQSTIRLPDW